MTRKTTLTLAAAALASLAMAVPAQAAYPGKNGRIAFGNHDIFSVKSSGKSLSDLFASPLGRKDEALQPSYSADGKQIVWTQGKVLGQHSLFIANADGSAATELTATAGSPGPEYPSFSPDGKSVLYDDHKNIFVVDIVSGTTTKLAKGRQATYSPDGSQIAFVRDLRAESDIWTMDAGGGNEKEITKNYKSSGKHGRSFEQPDYSPDGKRILVISNWEAGTYLVHVMKASGKGLQAIGEEDDPSVQAASFSPDGEKIAFASYRHGDEGLWTMNVNGSHQREIAELGNFADGVSDWQPL